MKKKASNSRPPQHPAIHYSDKLLKRDYFPRPKPSPAPPSIEGRALTKEGRAIMDMEAKLAKLRRDVETLKSYCHYHHRDRLGGDVVRKVVF